MVQFGCCVEPKYLSTVKAAGYDFAEMRCEVLLPFADQSAWEEQKQRLLSAGIPITGFNVLLPRGMKVVGPTVSTGELTDYLNTVFPRMQEIGARHLSFGSGGARTVPAGFSVAHAREQLQEFVHQLGDYGERYDITVNVEPLNQSETNLIHTVREAVAVAESVKRPRVKVLADLYHMVLEQENLRELPEFTPWLNYVHVADTGRRYPGSGTYPYDQLLASLQAMAYAGPVSVECNWEVPGTEIEMSLRYLQSVFA